MRINIYELYTSPIKRFLARVSKKCTVTLSTGKELTFNKGIHCGSCSYNGSMTKREEQEYISAMMLIGF